MAYAAQQPWVRNLSLRDNVLFGKKYEKERYDQVLDACALVPDIAMLTGGDTTEIGERVSGWTEVSSMPTLFSLGRQRERRPKATAEFGSCGLPKPGRLFFGRPVERR